MSSLPTMWMMENNLHVQYDLANLPHCMQCILQIDHRYSWKQSKILDLFSDCIFLPPIEINTCTMQQTPAKDSASNVSHPGWSLTKRRRIEINLGLIWWQNSSERISHSKSYFWQRLYLFLLTLQFVAPIHIFISLLWNKAVKNLSLEFIHANFPRNPRLLANFVFPNISAPFYIFSVSFVFRIVVLTSICVDIIL